MPPTFGNGKICYIVMPSADVERSAEFYRSTFGWKVRRRSDGQLAFDDGVGEVSGTWAPGLQPFDSTGLTLYIMVDNLETTLELIERNGGTIAEPMRANAPEITAKFRDPSGNVFGLYQQER